MSCLLRFKIIIIKKRLFVKSVEGGIHTLVESVLILTLNHRDKKIHRLYSMVKNISLINIFEKDIFFFFFFEKYIFFFFPPVFKSPRDFEKKRKEKGKSFDFNLLQISLIYLYLIYFRFTR